jgi:hypothetical protein
LLFERRKREPIQFPSTKINDSSQNAVSQMQQSRAIYVGGSL